jgi:uncharacterized protein
MITDKQVQNLEKQLTKTGLPHMPVDSLQGFIAAIVSGPQLVPPSAWLPLVFVSEKGVIPEFDSQTPPDYVIKALMDFYNNIVNDIIEDQLVPVVSSKIIDGNDKENFSPWCYGFMFGVTFWGDEWGTDEEEIDMMSQLMPIMYVADPEHFAEEHDAKLVKLMEEEIDEIIPEFGVLVTMIYYFWQERRKPVPIRANHIGRNDPCPCGSGKKYKKCCGTI